MSIMMLKKRGLAFLSLLLVLITTLVIFFHDNTDHTTRSFRIENIEVRMLSMTAPELVEAIKKEFEDEVSKLEDLMDKKAENDKGKCLKDPSATNNSQEQLQSFVEGECAPVILIPGIISTKLMVEIDCETLNENHSEIMQACGWSTCSWRLLHKRPASEYVLWIPSITSPLSIISVGNSSTCFGQFVKPNYNASAPTIHEKYVYPKGVRITWYGNTPKTKSKADGGLAAIRNLLPLPYQTQGTQKFALMTKYLKALGYQSGLTLFGVPYNFLLTYLANEVSYTLERTIRYAYQLTGKKVVLVAHSLGNLNTLAALNRISQEDKEQMVAAYLSIAPPFGGDPETLRDALGGDPAYEYSFDINVDFFNQASFVGGASSIQDLMPKDLFYRFRNETWLQDLLKRVQLEKQYDPNTPEGKQFWEQTNSTDLPYSFFPTPAETCFNGFTNRSSQCMIGVTDLATEPIATIADHNYYANISSIEEMVQDYYTLEPIDVYNDMWNDSLQAGIESFKNPGVPIIYVYASHLPTPISYEWDKAPQLNTSHEKDAFPTRDVTGNGDGTVEVTFSLPTAFKWAWESINLGDQANAKPIKILEFCSTYNNTGGIWDGNDTNGTRFMNKTNYLSLKCHCGDSLPTNGKHCFHSQMTNDPYINDLVRETATTNQTVLNLNATAAFSLSNETLSKLQKDIPYLTRPREDQNVTAWFNNSEEMTNSQK